MNSQLIEKVIKSQNGNCPEFTNTNPLLDHNVTKALSKSFVKILASAQNTNVNNNLRFSILESIRKICKNEPENHVRLTEDHSELLTDFYRKNVLDTSPVTNDTDKELDAFLIRNFKELNIKSSHTIQVNAEVTQAFINLNIETNLSSLTDNLIHWNTDDKQSKTLLYNICSQNTNSNINDVAIKNKPEIEKILLDTCLKYLINETFNLESEISKEQYQRLFKTCAIAPYCFQICINILNLLFVCTNFDLKILKFVALFIENVNLNCIEYSLSCLYPTHLKHIAMLLDIDLDELASPVKEQYIATSMKYLKDIQNKSESDYILLLSHFPQWLNRTI